MVIVSSECCRMRSSKKYSLVDCARAYDIASLTWEEPIMDVVSTMVSLAIRGWALCSHWNANSSISGLGFRIEGFKFRF
jgi:hypothetical protein